jgi:1,4-alpha-glucan branching enzyme
MNWPEIEAIVYAEEDRPHDILGPHVAGNSTLLQTFQPGATAVMVVIRDEKDPFKMATYKMAMADEEGFFSCVVSGRSADYYSLKVTDGEGNEKEIYDAYAFAPDLFHENDIDKFAAGIHYTLFDKLGAHPRTIRGVEGTSFAVWAPNALRVSVVGDFNNWDGRAHQMQKLDENGVFEIFIPGVKAGNLYKYELKIRGGVTYMKSDPYAYGQQLRPDTASIVRDLEAFSWDDKEWLAIRKARQDVKAPISVYELYLGSFKKEGEDYLDYRELTPLLVEYVKKMRYTHVELMPIMEHSDDASWGFKTTGYYAPTARYGEATDFMYMINELHRANIGVILAWSPAYFPPDEHGLVQFDGTCLYEHLDPRQGRHPHNGCLLYNYGRPEVANFLIAGALYWVEKFHIDGIRVDAMTSMLYLDYGKTEGQWVANIYGGHENLEAIEMFKHLNSVMKRRNPGVLMIADETSAWPLVTAGIEEGGLGFSLKWNSGWLNDYLRYIEFDPYFRAHHHHELTFSMIYAYSERFMLAFSHQEVSGGKSGMIGKMPGHVKDKFANLRLTYAYQMMHPGKKLGFMGQEMAEFREFDEKRELQWALLEHTEHKQLNLLVQELNDFYRSSPALYVLDNDPAGFCWLNSIAAEKCMVSFCRMSKKVEETLIVIANFANMKQIIDIGVPLEGKYREVFNTDETRFGGNGRINNKILYTAEYEVDGFPYSFPISAAPLSLLVFGYEPLTDEEREGIFKNKETQIKERLAEEKAAAEEKAQAEIRALEESAAASRAAAEQREKEEIAAAEARAASELERLFKRVKNSRTAAKAKTTKAAAQTSAKKSGRKPKDK